MVTSVDNNSGCRNAKTMKWFVEFILRWQEVKSYKQAISTLRRTVRSLECQVDETKGQVELAQRDFEREQRQSKELQRQIDILEESLEKANSTIRIREAEIEELAALQANRLKRIQNGEIDYREQDE